MASFWIVGLDLVMGDNWKIRDAQRAARLDRTVQRGKWHFVLTRGVLGWGITSGVLCKMIESEFFHANLSPWYFSAPFSIGTFMVAGTFWGLAMWFLMVRRYEQRN